MINVPITAKAYGVYKSAVRFIARQLGPATPTPQALIQHELSHRDARVVAEEYVSLVRLRRRLKRARRGRPLFGTA